MFMLNWFKKPHVHKPIDPLLVAILRCRIKSGQTMSWRCECGEMVKDVS